MDHKTAVAFACVSVSTLVGSAFGQVSLVSQSRSITPSTVGPAGGFGPYADSGAASSPQIGTACTAQQTSDLSVTGATFDLRATGLGTFSFPNSTGTSTLTFVFNAAAGVQYALDATGFQSGGPGTFGSGEVLISLVGPGVNVHQTVVNFQQVSVHSAGTLSGGNYTLSVVVHGYGEHAQGQDWGGSANTVGTLTLTPAPGAAALLGLVAVPGLRRRRR